jgi:hypothetical protein
MAQMDFVEEGVDPAEDATMTALFWPFRFRWTKAHPCR